MNIEMSQEKRKNSGCLERYAVIEYMGLKNEYESLCVAAFLIVIFLIFMKNISVDKN